MERKIENHHSTKKLLLTPAIRVVIVMLAVTAVAYPLSLLAVGQAIFPFQSNGSIVNLDSKPARSLLIAQEFASPKFFHSRPATDSASGVDRHITPEDAYLQIQP